MHFDENRQALPLRGRSGFELLRQRQVVNRIDAVKKVYGAPSFIAL